MNNRNEGTGHYEEEVYIIPHNYKDNGKILGLVEKRALAFSLIWLIPLSIIDFYLLPIPIKYKVYFFILIILPPTILIMVGIGHDSVEDFAKYVFKHYKNARIYKYGK